MPITVRHEPGAEMAALAGLLSGQGQQAVRQEEQRVRTGDLLTQLDSRRQMQAAQIKAQAEAQDKASDDAFKRDAIRSGLTEDLQQRELDNRLTQMQEEARIEASRVEYQFTAKQRQEIARHNRTDQLIDQSDRFNEEEKVIMHRQNDMGRMGILKNPGVVPADPNRQVFQPTPDGQPTDIGTQWTVPGVGTFTREPDGKIVNQVTFDKTEDGIRVKSEIEAEKAAEARQLKLEDAARKYAIDLEDAEVPVVEPRVPGTRLPIIGEVGGEEGGLTGAKRPLNEGEKRARMRKHFPELFQNERQAQSPLSGAGAFGGRSLEDVKGIADSFGIELTPAQKSASQDVQEAILFLKVAAASFRGAPPEDVAVQMRAKAQLIAQWERNQ